VGALALGLLAFAYVHFAVHHGQTVKEFRARHRWVRWSVYFVLALGIYFGAPDTTQFIYFQF
jgi:hypothetical protein